MKLTIFAAFAATALFASPAYSQATGGSTGDAPLADPPATDDEGFTGFVGLGAGAINKYDGSEAFQIIPLVIADLRYKDVSFEIRGLNGRLNLVDQEQGFVLGPQVDLNPGGRSSSDGGVARGLNKIGTEIGVGGFVGYRVGGDERGQGQVQFTVSALKDVSNTSDGLTVTGEVGYALLRTDKFIAGVDASVTYADKKHLRTYFGITPAETLTSARRLAAYRPGAGLRDVGVGVTAGYQFNARWGLIGRAGYNRYIGEAGDSPITREGTRNAFLGGAGVSFRF